MDNDILIDGLSLKETYGMTPLKGGLNNLIEFPPSKAVSFVDYPDEAYSRADLSILALEPRTFEMQFFYQGIEGADNLISLFLSVPYHSLSFAGKTFDKVRLAKHPSLVKWDSKRGVIGMTFCHDEGYKLDYSEPSLTSEASGYVIDGVDVSAFGLVPLKGTTDAMNAAIDYKNGLTRSLIGKDGQSYDENPLDRYDHDTDTWYSSVTKHLDRKMNSYDLAMHFHVLGSNTKEIMQNYEAFLKHITRKDTSAKYDTDRHRRTLSTPNGDAIHCFYKSCKVDSFMLFPAWLDISITFTRVV